MYGEIKIDTGALEKIQGSHYFKRKLCKALLFKI